MTANTFGSKTKLESCDVSKLKDLERIDAKSREAVECLYFHQRGFVCGLACLILKKKLSLNSFWVSWGFAFGVAIAIFAFVFIGGTALVNYLTNSF